MFVEERKEKNEGMTDFILSCPVSLSLMLVTVRDSLYPVVNVSIEYHRSSHDNEDLKAIVPLMGIIWRMEDGEFPSEYVSVKPAERCISWEVSPYIDRIKSTQRELRKMTGLEHMSVPPTHPT